MALLERIPRPVREVGTDVVREYHQDRLGGLAAEVAFFAVLSVFPYLLVMASLLGSIDALLGGEVATRAQSVVLEFLDRILTQQAAGALNAVEGLFEENRQGALTIGALVAVWSSSRGFVAVIRALNLAYDAEEQRPWIRLRILAVLLAVGAVLVGAIVLAMFVAGPLLGSGEAFADLLGLGSAFVAAWNWVRWPAAFVVLILAAAFLYRVAPTCEVPWRSTFPGALATAVLWLLASAGFGVYVRIASGTNPVLGALGGALLLLIWLYLLSLSLLLGGEINGVLAARRRRVETSVS